MILTKYIYQVPHLSCEPCMVPWLHCNKSDDANKGQGLSRVRLDGYSGWCLACACWGSHSSQTLTRILMNKNSRHSAVYDRCGPLEIRSKLHLRWGHRIVEPTVTPPCLPIFVLCPLTSFSISPSLLPFLHVVCTTPSSSQSRKIIHQSIASPVFIRLRSQVPVSNCYRQFMLCLLSTICGLAM